MIFRKIGKMSSYFVMGIFLTLFVVSCGSRRKGLL